MVTPGRFPEDRRRRRTSSACVTMVDPDTAGTEHSQQCGAPPAARPDAESRSATTVVGEAEFQVGEQQQRIRTDSLSSGSGGASNYGSTPPTAPPERRRRRRSDTTARNQLSGLLAQHGVASGRYACGATLDAVVWPWMPRIKQKIMSSCLTLPLSTREAEKLKAAQIRVGQGLDLNADGQPETRLPWAIRPETDFKIVNYKVWTTKVVGPIVKKVRSAVACCCYVIAVGVCSAEPLTLSFHGCVSVCVYVCVDPKEPSEGSLIAREGDGSYHILRSLCS